VLPSKEKKSSGVFTYYKKTLDKPINTRSADEKIFFALGGIECYWWEYENKNWSIEGEYLDAKRPLRLFEKNGRRAQRQSRKRLLPHGFFQNGPEGHPDHDGGRSQL
jgi:hypothetical protein